MLFSGQWGYGSDSRARFSWELLGLERECVVWTVAVMNYTEEGMMALTQSKTVHQRVTRSQPQQRLSPGVTDGPLLITPSAARTSEPL